MMEIKEEQLDENLMLDISNFSVEFITDYGNVKALQNIDLKMKDNEFIGIVGESGSGKSTLALAISALLPPNAKTKGYIKFKGKKIAGEGISGVEYKKVKGSEKKILTDTLANIRWKGISMIFQGAMNAFNPVYTIGKQLEEVYKLHTNLSKEDIHKKLIEILKTANLDPSILKSYPHELSGGMKQRAIIAMALALSPDLVIADEPTTGLDVISQAKIINELKRLRKEGKIKSLIIISHDIGVVSQLADRILVMYGGYIFEEGNTSRIIQNPLNPYTYALLNSYPSISKTNQILMGIPGKVPDLIEEKEGCIFSDRCPYASPQCLSDRPDLVALSNNSKSYCHFAKEIESNPTAFFNSRKAFASSYDSSIMVRKDLSNEKVLLKFENLTKYFDIRSKAFGELFSRENVKRMVHAVDDISIEIKKSEILGVVGESGSGKTTLGRLLMRTISVTSGSIKFNFGDENDIKLTDISKLKEKSSIIKEYRKYTQMIFQDPYDSLNPKMIILDIVQEPIIAHKITKNPIEREEMVIESLEVAKITPPERYLYRFPHEISGGERQRVAIARALVLKPKFLVADEPISMLDVSLRADFLNLLLQLRKDFSITLVYITHDIASARYICDNIMVMYLGIAVEYGPSEEIIREPLHPYTKSLIKAIPDIAVTKTLSDLDIKGEVGNAVDIPKGCRFYDRCIYAQPKCKDEKPPIIKQGNHWYVCHFSQEELYRIKEQNKLNKSLDNE